MIVNGLYICQLTLGHDIIYQLTLTHQLTSIKQFNVINTCTLQSLPGLIQETLVTSCLIRHQLDFLTPPRLISLRASPAMDCSQFTQAHDGWTELQDVLRSDQPVVIDGHSLTIAGVVAVAMYASLPLKTVNIY